jgi:outer membrane receptor protein involved in Fe transport
MNKTCTSRTARALAFIALFSASSIAARGQTGAITGRVSSGPTALNGATVTIQELDRTVIAGADGSFSIDKLAPGTYTVVVRRLGYATKVWQLAVKGNEMLDAKLSPTAMLLPDVTVTASRSPLAAFATPLPTSSPATETLRRSSSISIAHAVDGLPGVHSLTTGGQIGKPVIRGFAGSRVLVMQNGLRLEDYSWSDEDGPSIDARLADRIEVIRGPASLLYGSDAIGGVVNAISAPLPEGQAKTRGLIELSGGSNAREAGLVLQGEGARGGMGWRLTAIPRFAEALHTPVGELENTGFFAFNGQAAAGWHGSWGSLNARFDQYGGEFKLLEANGPPPGVEEGEEEGPERKMADQRVQIIGNFPTKHFRFEPKLQYQRHWLAEMADAAEVGGTGIIETKIFDLLLNTFSADLLAHSEIGGRIRTTFGISGIHQSNDSRAPAPGLPFVPDANINSIAGFGIGQMQMGRVSLLGGARIDHRSLTADANPTLDLTAQDISHNAVSANIGTAIRVAKGAAITANVGRAWRAPNLFELFANGPLFAEGRYVIGDASLEPETALDIDGGFKWSGSRARFEVSVFRNRVTDYVFLQPTNETRPAPDGTTSLNVYRYMAADAVLRGGEIGAEFEPRTFLTLRARYDVVRGENDDTGENLPLMSPPRVDVETEFHTTKFKSWGRAFVNVGVEHELEQKHLNPLDVATDAYTLINLGAGIEPSGLGRRWRVDLRVHNLANTEYRNFLSRYKAFALNPGRDVVLRIGFGF